MTRKETLERAAACVCGQREQDYGSPEDNFARVAALWSAYKGEPFSAQDVGMMMALLKVGRIASGRATEDSFVDLAGYAACTAEIVTKPLTFGHAVCDNQECPFQIGQACPSASACGGFVSPEVEMEV